MSYVFISYNQTDSDIAALMMMQLEKAGMDTWLDKHRLRGGQDWSVEIDRGITEAFALVVIMSPEAKASEYVTYEWSFAIGAGVPVIPVLIRSTELHPRLARIQYLDFTNNARPWENLLKELRDIYDAGGVTYRIPRDAPAFIKRAAEELDSPNRDDRRGGIITLGEADHPVARDILTHALRHPLFDVRLQAATLVGRRGDQRALPVLIDELINVRPNDIFGPPSGRIVQGTYVQDALVRIGRPAVPKLLECLKSQQGPFKDLIVRPVLTRMLDDSDVPLLLSWLQGQDSALKLDAVVFLGSIGGDKAVPHLVELWSNSTDVNELVVVAEALVASEGARAVPIFRKAIQTKDPSTQSVAVSALGTIGSDEAVNTLIQIVRGVGQYDDAVQKAALNTLQRISSSIDKARNFLIEWEREHTQGGSFPGDKD